MFLANYLVKFLGTIFSVKNSHCSSEFLVHSLQSITSYSLPTTNYVLNHGVHLTNVLLHEPSVGKSLHQPLCYHLRQLPELSASIKQHPQVLKLHPAD